MLKKHPGICVVLALLGAAPFVVAEYRRITMGIFDVSYWLLSCFLILSIWSLYQIFGPSRMKGYEAMSEQERAKKKLDPFTVKCNALALCVFIIAIFAFAVSGILRLL